MNWPACITGIPSFMKPLLPTEEERVIKSGNMSRFHRHSFETIPWDEKHYGPATDFDEIPPVIDLFNPPRMRNRWLRRCNKKNCGATVLITRTSMM